MTAPIRLFVGNLPNNVNENELRAAFSTYGDITAMDIKTKSSGENENKQFAFVTLSASNYDIETCIKHFTNEDFNGSRLYVTRARESFLERLQREREQAQRKENEKNEPVTPNFNPKPLNIKSHKRQYDTQNMSNRNGYDKKPKRKFEQQLNTSALDARNFKNTDYSGDGPKNDVKDDNKQNSDTKRLESMKKKRQEFNQKKMIIKSGLIGVDKAPNKKVIFSDIDEVPQQNGHQNNDIEDNNIENNKKRILFEEGDDSDTDVNFKIKKQFEGKKGQKVLDLQSRYKADKRFVLDERFIEDAKSDEEPDQDDGEAEGVELGQEDEKYKQLNILQDVLGVPIKMKQPQDHNKQAKSKLGMLRFDPTQPEHAKFLAPVEVKKEQTKKLKKKNSKETTQEEIVQEPAKEIEKVEVSKEQFYKVSETLKEALEQPTAFSLRSLFGTKDEPEDLNNEMPKQDGANLSINKKDKKVKNPLDPGDKNPFIYDSSDSEEEEANITMEVAPQISESKPVWREKLFFSESDDRLKEGLLFFTKTNAEKANKDRRELKTVMKKRIYNKERKNQMFQKKIGGRRKAPKKSFKRKH